ncbi:unnamed protein product, partial [Ectocarpus sp. 13 AM-2016]
MSSRSSRARTSGSLCLSDHLGQTTLVTHVLQITSANISIIYSMSFTSPWCKNTPITYSSMSFRSAWKYAPITYSSMSFRPPRETLHRSPACTHSTDQQGPPLKRASSICADLIHVCGDCCVLTAVSTKRHFSMH